MGRNFASSADHMDSAASTLVATPASAFGWVKRTAPGSFGKLYFSFGASDSEKWQLAEEITGSSGKGAGYQYHSGSANAGVSAVVPNSTWTCIVAVYSGFSSRSTTVGATKVSSSASMADPVGANKTTVNGTIASHTNGSPFDLAHFGGLRRGLVDIEVAHLIAGGSPHYLQHTANDSYWYCDQTATEGDQWGTNNLTVTGTTASADNPDLASFWTGAAFGNQSYTQGTAISAVDLTTKFANVHSTYTTALKQVGSGSQVTTANGSGTATTILNVLDASSFTQGDYVSVNTGSPTLVVRVSGTTLMLGTAQTWASADAVYRYPVSARTFSGGPVITANSYGGTPVSGDVGSFPKCLIRATCSNNSALFADSPLFDITIASSGAAPSFSSGPTLSTRNTDGYSFGATSNQTATWYAVAMLKGSTAPTSAQVKSGSPTGFVARFSTALTATVAGTLNLTGLTLPTYDLYHVVDNGSGTSAVASQTDQLKAPPNGSQYSRVTLLAVTAITKANPAQVTATAHGRSTGDWVQVYGVSGMTQINGTFAQCTKIDANTLTLTGIDSTGYSTYTSGGFLSFGQSVDYGASPAVATGDVRVVDAVTSPDGFAILPRADGGFSIAAALGVSRRQSFSVNSYNVATGVLIGAGTVYVNNVPPNVGPQAPIYFPLNQTLTPVALGPLATSQDTLTVTALTALPAGMSITSSSLGGTPTAQGATLVNLQWQDAAGETTTAYVPMVVGQQTIPNVSNVGLDLPNATNLLQSNYFSNITAGSQNDPNPAGPAPAGIVIAQNPLANALADPNEKVVLTLSTGIAQTTQVVVPTVVSKAPTLLAQEKASAQSQPFTQFILQDTCIASNADIAGTTYRFYRVPSSAQIVDLELMNDSNPSGSTYKIGLYLPNGGGEVVSGSSSLLCPSSLSLDIARNVWTSVYFPAIAGRSPSVAYVAKRLWELLGLSRDPSGNQDVVYDVAITAINPGQGGGAIALRLKYIRGPDRGLITAAPIT